MNAGLDAAESGASSVDDATGNAGSSVGETVETTLHNLGNVIYEFADDVAVAVGLDIIG